MGRPVWVTDGTTGSTLTQNGASTLTAGHAFGGTATINVTDRGVFTTGMGLTTLETTGTLNVNTSGTFNALETLIWRLRPIWLAAPGANAGQINLQSGTVEFAQVLINGATGNILGRGTQGHRIKISPKQQFFEEPGVPCSFFSLLPQTGLRSVLLEQGRHKAT